MNKIIKTENKPWSQENRSSSESLNTQFRSKLLIMKPWSQYTTRFLHNTYERYVADTGFVSWWGYRPSTRCGFVSQSTKGLPVEYPEVLPLPGAWLGGWGGTSGGATAGARTQGRQNEFSKWKFVFFFTFKLLSQIIKRKTRN
jgi:hypothetical protein